MTDEMMPWEKEVLANHRWGRQGDKAATEHQRLRRLQETAGPLDDNCRRIADQIIDLEICNWNLENSLPALCRAIGAKQPLDRKVGHLWSISAERWRSVWAYDLALRSWLAGERPAGFEVAREACDPGGAVRDHVLALIGERNELKELYVERFCLCLEFWLAGLVENPARKAAHEAAVSAVEGEIRKRDPSGRTLKAMASEGNGMLQPCHHKAFRRYDIILSSIGAGKWRGAMPPRGDGPAERVATLERFLSPIQEWIDHPTAAPKPADEPARSIHASLGEPDAVKTFLAELLASLLRAQQQEARDRIERAAEEGRSQRDRVQEFSCPEKLTAADGSATQASTRWRGVEGDWSVDADGRILGQAGGNGRVCRLPEHADHLRITATMRAVEGNEVSVWICGSLEETEYDGYTLAVSTEGAKLQRRGQDVARVDVPRIERGRDHVLSFERRGAELRGFFDGAQEPFVRWTDPDPLSGPGHRRLGFYVWDGAIAAGEITIEEFTQ